MAPILGSIWLAGVLVAQGPAAPSSFSQNLAAEDPSQLAQAFRQEGNASRGALVFFAPQLMCAKCHEADAGAQPAIGPDLARIGRETTDAHLIASILAPSQVVKPEYATVTIATSAGQVVTGRIVSEDAATVVVRTAAPDQPAIAIAKADIEERQASPASLMPTGQVDTLTRTQVLDLLRYLREIADLGPTRAAELRPSPSLLAVKLPAYEENLDHAGMIAELGPENLARGEAIFRRVCANCHGSKDQPGSMPTSMRFASGIFQNGKDPLSLYRTLTHGFRQMPPQSWMVPQQKYDVIHYLRETYLKADNPSQYARVDPPYLDALPRGTERGPEPSTIEPWRIMDYGQTLMATVEVGNDASNFAYKGIAVRLDEGPGGVSRGSSWVVYDHDTMRVAAAWTGDRFIDWQGINFDGEHGVHPRVSGKIAFANPNGPGWREPVTNARDDPRANARDGRKYGPMPSSWIRYRGLYRHADRAIVSYEVGSCAILEMPGRETNPDDPSAAIFTRTLEVGKSPHDLTMRVADGPAAAAVVGMGAALLVEHGETLLRIPASATPTTLKVMVSDGDVERLRTYARKSASPSPLEPLTRGGPSLWPEVLKTQVIRGAETGPFQVDVLTHPASNPWNSRMRLSGFDFFPDGQRAAVCDWDGDVWMVDGLDAEDGVLSWRRIASGLFQPLGLKIVDGQIYVGCRDQIAILRDLDGDGETDFTECFNTDHQVTEHFHEFAMGLQTDAQGNFYYAKAARHGKTAVVPQHGTLLKVNVVDSRTEIVATGFRAPNGVCVNEDGTFFVTDQEGFWNPKNRINHVKRGRFYGNMWGYHDVVDPSDAAMEPPLCWITNAMDRSPAELVRVPANGWKSLAGSLLSLSYGYGKIFVVASEEVGGTMQGGVVELPIPQLPTGIMRGRFRESDHQLYVCGLFGWAGNQEQPGGFYRIRDTEQPLHVPIRLEAHPGSVHVQFGGRIDAKSIEDPGNVAVKTWSLKRSRNYGSEHFDEKPAIVRAMRLSPDRKTLILDIPDLKPTWSMEIRYVLRGEGGEPVAGVIHNTIHRIADH